MKDLKLLGNTKEKIPSIGLGTWGVGGYFEPVYSRDVEEVEALRRGIELGMTLIDTAEVYARGHSEELVGEAIKNFSREEVFVVTKVWHTNLRYDDVLKAAKRSLKRLKTSYIDLYLIHWPNPKISLRDTMKALEKLVDDGIVRYIGVSNFSVELLEEARSHLSREEIVVDQVKYNLLDRSVELDLLPYCRRERITVMAYTPLAKGMLARDKFLEGIGAKYGKTAAQVALNWLIYDENVVAIPKASNIKHVEENSKAMGWRLKKEDYNEISRRFR